MSHELLIEDLRRKGDEKCRLIRQEAEADAERFRAEVAKNIEQKTMQYQQQEAAACEMLSKALLTDAVKEARKIELEAEARLADRLSELARQALAGFRNENYEELFTALAKELPPRQWEAVRVSPADEELARHLFPQTEIVVDGRIIAGLEATGEQGGIRIVNTLEKRLERAWPTMLPRIYSQISQELDADESSR